LVSFTLLDISRNDFEAARRYYEARGRRITEEEFHILVRFQDDPEEFERRTARWYVVEKPKPEFP